MYQAKAKTKIDISGNNTYLGQVLIGKIDNFRINIGSRNQGNKQRLYFKVTDIYIDGSIGQFDKVKRERCLDDALLQHKLHWAKRWGWDNKMCPPPCGSEKA